ncbi:GyrI-like domain-containing protein [Paenibacillus sp. strain BS8-2]
MEQKYEWKKRDKSIYIPKPEPMVIELEPYQYFMLRGKGNPNDSEFQEAISALYSLSYAIKMSPKKGVAPQGYYDYTIFPLEGIWDLEVEARGQSVLNKDKLVYTLMMRQPDFVTAEVAREVIDAVYNKNPHSKVGEVTFEALHEGLNIQMMHIGPYDDEPQSFAIMEQFGEANQLKRISYTHKEIYISDFRKTAPEKLRTVLRYQVSRS